MYEKFRERKPKKPKKDGPSAFEIHQKTFFLHWPLLYWVPNAKGSSLEGSKKEALFKALNKKKEGLYFFAPGPHKTDIELHIFSTQTISVAEYSLKYLKRSGKEYTKKFGDWEEYFRQSKKRLYFLKKVIASFDAYQKKSPESLFLEQVVYFTGEDKYKPSFRVDGQSIHSDDPMANIVLCKKSLPNNLSKDIHKLIGQHPNCSAEFWYRHLFMKQLPPRLIDSILKLGQKHILYVLEEVRLQGIKMAPEDFQGLLLFLTELVKFRGELELRTCLATDIVKTVYEDKKSYTVNHEFVRVGPEFKNMFVHIMNSHLANRGFNFSAGFQPYNSTEWFLGRLTSKQRKELPFPKYFPSKDSRENYFKSFRKKCLSLYNPLDDEWFLKALMCFTFLSQRKSNSNKMMALIPLTSQCREFCPPGQSGNDSLKLSCLFYSLLQDSSDDEFDYLISIFPYCLNDLLTYVLNTGNNEQFTVPSYDSMSNTLNRIVPFIAKLQCSQAELPELLKNERLSTMIYMLSDANNEAIKWVLKQDKDWLDKACKNKSDWWYIFNTTDAWRNQLLKWSSVLRERGLKWGETAECLYSVYCRFDKEKQDLFINNFHLADRLYYLSEDLDAVLKNKFKVTYTYTFDDITHFLDYIDAIPNAWQESDAYFNVMAEVIHQHVKVHGGDEDFDLEEDSSRMTWIATLVKSPEELKKYLQVTPYGYSIDYGMTSDSLQWLKKNESAIFTFIGEFMQEPVAVRRVFNLLKSLKVAIRLNATQLRKSLKEWRHIAYEYEAETEQLMLFRKMAENSQELPRNIKRCLDMSVRLEREVKTLQSLSDKGVISDKAKLRLDKVNHLLDNPDIIKDIQDSEIARHMPDAISNAKLNALEKTAEKICHSHWVKISRRPIEKWDDDWNNALQLCFSTAHNKRLLKRLMHNAAGNDYQWIFYHPGNVKFLQKTDDKLNTQAWLKPHKQAHSINNHKYKLEVEHNLMKVLHMGNYFGSCLSVGEFNDFSTIANAVEINKHVIWMKNKQDKIIGRKLIVIDKKLRLYGFNSYGAALGGNKENHWIKILFDLYCLELAKATGTVISNDRDEEDLNLFARWYDDGTEGFDWWVIELSEGVQLNDIAKKLKYNPDNHYNLRAALWCDFSGVEVSADWNNLHAFQEARAKLKD